MNYPEWAKYKTRDIQGHINVYEYLPMLNDGFWKASDGRVKYIMTTTEESTSIERVINYTSEDTLHDLQDGRTVRIITQNLSDVTSEFPVIGLVTNEDGSKKIAYYNDQLVPELSVNEIYWKPKKGMMVFITTLDKHGFTHVLYNEDYQWESENNLVFPTKEKAIACRDELLDGVAI